MRTAQWRGRGGRPGAIIRDKAGVVRMLTLPALVAKWQTRTLEVRVG